MNEERDLLGFTNENLEELGAETIRGGDAAPQKHSSNNHSSFKQGISRFQSNCVGLCLDDRVAEDSHVRLIDLYVDQLNMQDLGFTRAHRDPTPGQPAYDPACLLKLYLYGYINQVRSGRRLARECEVNLEVMWLLEELTPRYRVINTFRADNHKALVKAHQDFVLLCRKLSLVDGKRVSIDGSHFKGNVSAKSFTTVKGLKKKQSEAKAAAEQWLAMLEEEETKESQGSEPSLDIGHAKEMLEQLKGSIAQTQEQLDELVQSGRTQRSSTDPDARLLRKRSKALQGYNVQIATDHKHYLIVGDAVTTDANDLNQLHPIASQVKQRFGLSTLEAVADKGYYNAQAIGLCAEEGIITYVPIPELARSQDRDTGYARSEFVYDAAQDVYRCPAAQLLRRVGKAKPRYRNRKACAECESRDKCLTGKAKYREIWPISQEQWAKDHEKHVSEHHQRMEQSDAQEIYAERHKAVEHPFGTLKRRAGHSHFHLRGKEKVSGEWSLMLLCYNFTRVLSVLGFNKFKAILEELVRSSNLFINRMLGAFAAIFSAASHLTPNYGIDAKHARIALTAPHGSIKAGGITADTDLFSCPASLHIHPTFSSI